MANTSDDSPDGIQRGLTTKLDEGRSIDPAGALLQGFSLEVVKGPDKGATYESSTSYCRIGTSRSCDLVLTDPSVSGCHCEIAFELGGDVRLIDTDSLNGTLLDGVRVERGFLRHGSLLQLGLSEVRFQYSSKSRRIPISERTHFSGLVGHSTAMRILFAQLESVARSDISVLLEGESGTGKTATARAIHAESARRDRPFIEVDCTTLVANLMESELFGHAKGSFTGASKDRSGAFELANGGSIFLDEIGELPRELQPKLLGALENRKIRRVGDHEYRPIDVRVIAATNRDLFADVNSGRFREDLYYRLSVVPIRVPALRQRRDDIPLLIQHLVERIGGSDEHRARLLDKEFVAELCRHAWPGNIRELKNRLERALTLGYDAALGVVAPRAPNPQPARSGLAVDTSLPLTDARQRVLAEFERIYVTEVLKAHDGRVGKAAEAAGVTRYHLGRLRKKYAQT